MSTKKSRVFFGYRDAEPPGADGDLWYRWEKLRPGDPASPQGYVVRQHRDGGWKRLDIPGDTL